VNRRSLVGPGEQGVLRATNVHNSRHIIIVTRFAQIRGGVWMDDGLKVSTYVDRDH
jgi:hypothetical protein